MAKKRNDNSAKSKSKKVVPFDYYFDANGKTCPSCHLYKPYVDRKIFVYNFAPRYSHNVTPGPASFLDRCYDCLDTARRDKGMAKMVRRSLHRPSLRSTEKVSILRRGDRAEIYSAAYWRSKVEKEQEERLMTKVKVRLKERGEI
jgi:hypothetical protein